MRGAVLADVDRELAHAQRDHEEQKQGVQRA
jgi:hypothetical protein